MSTSTPGRNNGHDSIVNELEAIAWEIATGVRTPGAREQVYGLRLECVDRDVWKVETVDGEPVDRFTVTDDTDTEDVLEHLEALVEEIDP